MTDQERSSVQQLVREKCYDEAYAILQSMSNDPQARQMMLTLEDFATHRVKKTTATREDIHREWLFARLTLDAAMFALCFVIAHNIFAGLIYVVYDLWLNRDKRKLDVNTIVVGVILSVGLSFAIRSLL